MSADDNKVLFSAFERDVLGNTNLIPRLWILDLKRRSFSVPATSYEGIFSPVGNFFAYNAIGYYGLYVNDLAGHQINVETSWARDQVFSPLGSKIVYTSRNDQLNTILVSYDLVTRKKVVVSATANGVLLQDPQHPTVAPDENSVSFDAIVTGTGILAGRSGRHVFVKNLKTGSLAWVSRTPLKYDLVGLGNSTPAFSADGAILFFQSPNDQKGFESYGGGMDIVGVRLLPVLSSPIPVSRSMSGGYFGQAGTPATSPKSKYAISFGIRKKTGTTVKDTIYYSTLNACSQLQPC